MAASRGLFESLIGGNALQEWRKCWIMWAFLRGLPGARVPDPRRGVVDAGCYESQQPRPP